MPSAWVKGFIGIAAMSYPRRYESLTDYKQANFGSKDAVERSYNAYSNINIARSEAKKHIDRITTEGKCQVPKPKIIPASNDRTKVFTPHCTILHRCEADTGCCAPPQTCAPKSTNDVKLFFYVSSDTYVSNIGPRQQSTVTTLTFTNHTECHCVQLDSVLNQRGSRPQIQNSLENSAEGSGGSSGSSLSVSCTCPHHFKPVIDNESQCYCDCLSSDRDCIRFKEGFENFSMETRKCIRSKKCNVPRCEYGMYNRHEGRCPKKIDRINEQFPQYR
uniref:Platelet-derived growth factor (PDGF) family profile domain-containing protein n=1 Tax=Anopheles minimus TaxID=112268 RepID=A0A182VV29_9DIPT